MAWALTQVSAESQTASGRNLSQYRITESARTMGSLVYFSIETPAIRAQ
jgi:hypothetical protein